MKKLQVVFAGAAPMSSLFWTLASLVHFPRLFWFSLTGPKELSDVLRRQSSLSALAAAFAAVAAATQAAMILWPSG